MTETSENRQEPGNCSQQLVLDSMFAAKSALLRMAVVLTCVAMTSEKPARNLGFAASSASGASSTKLPATEVFSSCSSAVTAAARAWQVEWHRPVSEAKRLRN